MRSPRENKTRVARLVYIMSPTSLPTGVFRGARFHPSPQTPAQPKAMLFSVEQAFAGGMKNERP